MKINQMIAKLDSNFTGYAILIFGLVLLAICACGCGRDLNGEAIDMIESIDLVRDSEQVDQIAILDQTASRDFAKVCEPVLTVEISEWFDVKSAPGAKKVSILRGSVATSACLAGEVSTMQFSIREVNDTVPSNRSLYCANNCASNSDLFFRNVKVQGSKNETLMGPSDFLLAAGNTFSVLFYDSFGMKASEQRLFTLELDISPLATSVIGKRYVVYFDGVTFKDPLHPNWALEVRPQDPKGRALEITK